MFTLNSFLFTIFGRIMQYHVSIRNILKHYFGRFLMIIILLLVEQDWCNYI